MHRSCCLLFILTLSCMSPQPNLIYADGSANRYEISSTELKYIPVRPEESSTGMYSGGEPAQASLTQQQYNQLKDLFESALAQTDQHLQERMKTSGLVVVVNGNNQKQVILKSNAPVKLAIEAELKRILGSK